MPLSWVRIAVFSVVIAYADGFLATSLHGAVGAIQRTQNPFDYWKRTSTLMLPFYALAVIGALQIARWWFGRNRKPFAKLAAAVLLVAMTAAVGIVQITGNSIKDYRIQVEQLSSTHAMQDTPMLSSTGLARTDSPLETGTAAACNNLCAAEHHTRAVHVKAVRLGTFVLLIMNAVLVAFLMVLLGDRLWRPTPVTHRPTMTEVPTLGRRG